MIFRTKVATLVAAPALALIAPAALGTAPAQAAVHAPASVQAHASVAAPAQVSSAVPRLAASHGAQSVAPDALGAVLCSGDVCIQSQCAHCNFQNIRVWANTYGFKGHFKLVYGCSVAGCNTFYSPNQYWRAGGTGYTFDTVPSAVISANVYGEKGGPPWTQIGYVFFYL